MIAIRRPLVSGRIVALGVALCLGLAAPAAALQPSQGWRITSFDVAIEQARDGTLDIAETIAVHFDDPRHGLIREIPVRYVVNGHLYDIRLHLRGVTDARGASHHWQAHDEENKLIIKIGDAKKLVQGDQTYVITYRVGRATLWEGDGAALRWNATGSSWRVPIERASASVTVPSTVPPDRISAVAYTGIFGAAGKDYTESKTDHTVRFATTRALGPGEGLSVEVFEPAEFLTKPSTLTQLGWWLADNFAYGLIPAGWLACLGAWLRWGRDAPGRGSVVVTYEPPKDLGPAEVGTLVDERVDLRDVSSTIVDLAVRGFLTIEEVKESRLLGLGKSTDYHFVKRKPAADLKPYEYALYEKLFGLNDSVKLSELQNRFFSVLPTVKSDLYGRLSQEGYFDGSPDWVRTKFLLFGLFALAAVLFAAMVAQFLWIGRVFGAPVVIAGIAVAPAVIATSRYMPRRTSKGRIAWENIRGLEEYISRAEVDDLKAQERQTIFERLLPYAVAFGLTKRWARAFEGLYLQPPDWYRTANDGPFNMVYFGSSLDNSVNSMNQTFPSQPRSEGGGGGDSGWSSGGFSGGGSVGGGFGGGGGDAW